MEKISDIATTSSSILTREQVFSALLTSWPFCLFLVAVAFLIIFKKQISNLIDRIIHGRAGKDGFEFDSPKPVSDEPIKEQGKKEEEVSENIYKEEKETNKTEEFVPKTLDEWRDEMIFAFIYKDKKRAEEAYKKVLELNNDKLLKKKDIILYLKFSHTLGDTSSVPELKKQLIDNEIAYEANMALGYCYASSGDFDSSFPFFKKASELASTDEEKSSSATNYSSALYRNGQKDDAIAILINALSDIEGDESKIQVYQELADTYEKEKDYENRAFAIEKALEIKPNDASLLFKAGYSYSQSQYDELSLLHYKSARRINPEDGAVLNNLGVQYESLNMPINSIENYKNAEKFD